MSNLLNLKELSSEKVKTKTNAGVLVETLVELGVDSIFGYPGASVLSIYNELSEVDKITHYLVRHEQAAVHAAEGYARVSGKVGVVLVTSGPGFTNTITGIANAYTDSTPLVVLAGDVSSENKSDKVFQSVDIESMTSSSAKCVHKLSKEDDIKNLIKKAFKEADSGIKGPVVIALPRNILESAYQESSVKNDVLTIKDSDISEKITEFKSILKSSKNPLILIGGGSINASEEIKRFAKFLNCPIVSTLMGIGIYPSDDENYLGMIGVNGSYQANYALNSSDLIIAMGAAFSDRSTCRNNEFRKKAKIINVNIKHISDNFEQEILCDVKEFVNLYSQEPLNISFEKNWNGKLKTLKSEMYQEENISNRLHSSYVLKTISDYTKKYEPIVVTDVGQHQMLTAQFFNFNKPRKFITSGGLGTMGFGLPAAIGAHIANPDNLTLNITGDGSFQMNLQELATCREHNIPIKIIIMNNGYLGMVRQLQEKIYNKRYQVEMTNPDFVKIAEAYDLTAIRVTKKEELEPAIQKALNHSGTVIVDVMIDLFENI